MEPALLPARAPLPVLKALRSNGRRSRKKRISSFHGTDFPSKVTLDGEVNGVSDSNSGLLGPD